MEVLPYAGNYSDQDMDHAQGRLLQEMDFTENHNLFQIVCCYDA